MTSHLLAAAAAVGLLGAGFANAGETRSFEAMTGQSAMFGSGQDSTGGGKCRVDVVRSGSAGTADVTRQAFSDGSCVCTVTTGPSDVNGSAEAIVSRLLRDRECEGAPAPGEEAAQAGGGGGFIGVLAGIVGVGGGIAASGSDSAG